MKLLANEKEQIWISTSTLKRERTKNKEGSLKTDTNICIKISNSKHPQSKYIRCVSKQVSILKLHLSNKTSHFTVTNLRT